jgi:hypothetical protein
MGSMNSIKQSRSEQLNLGVSEYVAQERPVQVSVQRKNGTLLPSTKGDGTE